MTLSWKESVALIIIDILKDPNISLHLMKILMPLRRDYLDDEARNYRLYLATNITISLSFAKRIDKLYRSIRYFNEGIVYISPINHTISHNICEKINFVNLVFNNSNYVM